MRHLVTASLILGLSAFAVGCNSGKSGSQTMDANKSMDAGKVADAKASTMQSGGKNVLSVMAAPDIACTAKDGHLMLKGHGNQLDIWMIADATSVTDGIAKVPEQIKSEFLGFKSKSSMDLTIAGNPAKQMTGSGNEADDNDPGSANVIVFKAGDHVFVSCVHGEHIPADAPAFMLAIVQTAKAQ